MSYPCCLCGSTMLNAQSYPDLAATDLAGGCGERGTVPSVTLYYRDPMVTHFSPCDHSSHTRLTFTSYNSYLNLSSVYNSLQRSVFYTLRVYPSHTPLLNEVEPLPPLASHSGRVFLPLQYCCWCYKESSNTLKSILSFRSLRAFSPRLVRVHGRNTFF